MSLDDLTSLVNNPNWAKYGLDFKIPSSRDFIQKLRFIIRKGGKLCR